MFLDRDGTLMEEVDYCRDPARVRLFDGATAALQGIKSLGFRLIIVTNQSGIGRGFYTEADFAAVQAELLRQVGVPGLIDATYHCPDAPEAASPRRKPGTGMLLEAASDFGLDLRSSFFVGDTSADVHCGQRAALAASILVLTGHGCKHLETCRPDHVAADLGGAVDWIAQQTLAQT